VLATVAGAALVFTQLVEAHGFLLSYDTPPCIGP
jgi:hypothetical protein